MLDGETKLISFIADCLFSDLSTVLMKKRVVHNFVEVSLMSDLVYKGRLVLKTVEMSNEKDN